MSLRVSMPLSHPAMTTSGSRGRGSVWISSSRTPRSRSKPSQLFPTRKRVLSETVSQPAARHETAARPAGAHRIVKCEV